ncbi:DR2241 family protein [Haloarcula laminariae]|uniref:DR2241 family protein n=1 Tax=Haloarcula laminariae TaxID=2961577 RepID=UPI002406BFF3|nr:DR2241 family protein [Halomicroarcula sp. FL173]
MNEDPVDALVATAPDGIDFDGLRVEESAGGYTFETPAATADGLDEATLRDTAAEDPHVGNWYFWHAVAPQTDARWAFLRWLEGGGDQPVPERYEALADGLTTEWGQLRVTVTLDGPAGRSYDLRHVDDAGTPADELDAHEAPLDARELAKHDDDGAYRPLKTAPSLRTGWQFPDLGAPDVVEAVHAFYPATVQNWHREREGELDIDHWHETVERQTGIYGVVRTWDRGEGYEHVNWVAEACCDDSQCLKRREWDYDEETELDVDGGDGAFPCREPCSLVIAGARQWTKLEGEQSQTYEFELTPSEKEQVEEIIDAVADGRADDIREADVYDGANRYRTRFLRAKLFDDDGNLAGVETDE